MLHINIKGIKKCSNMVANILPADPQHPATPSVFYVWFIRSIFADIWTTSDAHITRTYQSKKRAKIRNRYNQAPYLTQDTNGKVTTSLLDNTNPPRGYIIIFDPSLPITYNSLEIILQRGPLCICEPVFICSSSVCDDGWYETRIRPTTEHAWWHHPLYKLHYIVQSRGHPYTAPIPWGSSR